MSETRPNKLLIDLEWHKADLRMWEYRLREAAWHRDSHRLVVDGLKVLRTVRERESEVSREVVAGRGDTP